MSSPSAWPIGSWLFRPIPVDLPRACPSTCPAIFPGVRPDAPAAVFLPTQEINRARQFPNHFCPPASIPTCPSFPGCHNWSQISGVPDGQMTLCGIAGLAGWRVGVVGVVGVFSRSTRPTRIAQSRTRAGMTGCCRPSPGLAKYRCRPRRSTTKRRRARGVGMVSNDGETPVYGPESAARHWR